MPLVDAYRAKIHYEVAGDGPPIVFLHGFDGNSLGWFQQLPFFARHYRAITVDLRTYVGSTCAYDDFHPRHFVEDLAAVLDAERVEAAAFICQSLGAWGAMPLAIQQPKRVACIAINGSPTPAYSPGNWIVLQRAIQIANATLRREIGANAPLGFAPDFAARRPELFHLYFRLNELNGPRDLSTVAADELKLYPRDLARYRTPTLVTGGAHDHFLTPENHKHVATLIPFAECHTFPDAGHSAFYETPGDFNRTVGAFLAKHFPGRDAR